MWSELCGPQGSVSQTERQRKPCTPPPTLPQAGPWEDGEAQLWREHLLWSDVPSSICKRTRAMPAETPSACPPLGPERQPWVSGRKDGGVP